MNFRSHLRLLPVLFLILLVQNGCRKAGQPFHCSDPLGCVDIAPKAPIKIGILQALTGDVAPLGIDQVRGIQLAIADHHGILLGKSIALQQEDSGCSVEGGANAVLKIIADPQTVAILGTTCSASAATASAAMSKTGFTMVSGNNSAPYLTSIGGKAAPDYHPGYFRTAPNEESSGQAAAIFAFQKLGIREAATINDGDIYTRGLTDGFSHTFLALGGKIVLDTSINKGDTLMQPVLQAVLNSGARLLFFPLFQPEGNFVLLQARETPGFNKIVLMSDGSLIENSFLKSVREKAKGMYFIGPSFTQAQPEAVAALTRKYKKKFSLAPMTRYFLSAYDATNLLFSAIEKTAVREDDGTIHIGRLALRKALYSTTDFPGITGDLACDRFGDCARPAFNVLRLDDPSAGIQGLEKNVVFSYVSDK